MADPRKQLIGQRSKAAGETFERWISAACEFYKNRGWAHIEKTPEPFHITGRDRDGTIKGYYEKKGQPDYKGILCDGTGIMFEAKHTDSDRMRQEVVTDTQWENLDLYEKFGAHCYVMVSIAEILPCALGCMETYERTVWPEVHERGRSGAVPAEREYVHNIDFGRSGIEG